MPGTVVLAAPFISPHSIRIIHVYKVTLNEAGIYSGYFVKWTLPSFPGPCLFIGHHKDGLNV